MKKLFLNDGEFAIVDEKDFKLLSHYSWYRSEMGKISYAVTNLSRKMGKNRKRLMHRLIMNPPQNFEIDHINGNGLDNRRENLRIVTSLINKWNRHNKIVGAYLDKRSNSWVARMRINYRTLTIGNFKSKDTAMLAYQLAKWWRDNIYDP